MRDDLRCVFTVFQKHGLNGFGKYVPNPLCEIASSF